MKVTQLLKLAGMMFVQNMIFPVWFNTIVPYVRTLPGGEKWVPLCGVLMGIGMFGSPLVCMFADRYLDSGKVLAICNFASAGALGAAMLTQNPAVLFCLLLVSTIFLMPTWSVVAALTMAHLPTSTFPYIRACGSIGWAASAVFSFVAIRWLGLVDFEVSSLILGTAAGVAAFAGVLALLMPPTPPKAKGERASLADAFGLKAFVLLKDKSFLLLSALILLSMIPFQWYMGYNTLYLAEAGFTYLNLTQNLGQLAELGFMVLLPFLFKRFSFRGVLLIGFTALVIRYACYTGAVLTGCHALDFGGILIHGLIFGILIVAFQMHAAEVAPPELKNQAQGFVMLLTAGLGGFLSVGLFDRLLRPLADGAPHNWRLAYPVALAISLVTLLLAAFFYRPKATEET